ncbi:MAG: hypothetical protein ACTHKA_16420 [Anaerocolumna jejuensis]
MAVPQTSKRYAIEVSGKEKRKAPSHPFIYGSTADRTAVCNESKVKIRKRSG